MDGTPPGPKKTFRNATGNTSMALSYPIVYHENEVGNELESVHMRT